MEASGLCVEVSILNASATRLGGAASIRTGASASLVFSSGQFGDSPVIFGAVKSAKATEHFTELSIEIADWGKLAHFWSAALGH